MAEVEVVEDQTHAGTKGLLSELMGKIRACYSCY